jgi:hypothetical protein
MRTTIASGCVILACWTTAGPLPAGAEYVEVGGVGNEGQGAGMVVTNLNNNPLPEVILMALDNPDGPNEFRYRLGLNLDLRGAAQNWSPYQALPSWSSDADGAGIAITNLDHIAWPELILMAYRNDDPAGPNDFVYHVLFNRNSVGMTPPWQSPQMHTSTAPGVGNDAHGAGLAVAQLDDNPRPDMILMAYDDPPGANVWRYRVGLNLDPVGTPAAGWSAYVEVPALGHEAQGAGIAIGQLDANPRPDMVLMAYDNPSHANSFEYRLGFNLDANGIAAFWGPVTRFPGVGSEGQGADVVVGAPIPFVAAFMAYDNPHPVLPLGNAFRFQVFPRPSDIQVQAPLVHLEIDKLDGVAWPPDVVERLGDTHSLEVTYALIGIAVRPVRHEGAIPDLHPGVPYNRAELDAFRLAHMNLPPPLPEAAHVHAAMLTASDTPGTTGIMFNHDRRQALVVFANVVPSEPHYLRTLVHELGHALNLLHTDGDAWGALGEDRPVPGLGFSIMNQTRNLNPQWNFAWSAVELDHFRHHLLERWRPGSGSIFGGCHEPPPEPLAE